MTIGLWRLAFILLRVDERLEARNIDLVERAGTEERDEVDAKDGFVVHQRAAFPAEHSPVIYEVPAGGGDVDHIDCVDERMGQRTWRVRLKLHGS